MVYDSGDFLLTENYTGSSILALLLSADGSGSLLDADRVDGYEATDFVMASEYTAANVLALLSSVDGAASGLDADKLDGLEASSFLRSNAADQKSSGALTFADSVHLNLGGGSDVEHFFDGTDYFTDLNNGASWLIRDGASENTTQFQFYSSSGNLSIGGALTASSLVSTSAERFKENIEALDTEEALAKVLGLEGVSFTWKATGEEDIGLIAEDVEDIYPEFVGRDAEGEVSGIEYGKLVSVLIAAIQELNNKIDTYL